MKRRAIEILLGLIFLVAGVIKACDPNAFYSTIDAYRLLPSVLVLGLAYYLPYLEIVLGLGLMTKVMAFECSCVMAGLVGVFLFALISAWLRGLNIDCGCFGPADSSVGYLAPILRDAVVGAAVLYCIRVNLMPEAPPERG